MSCAADLSIQWQSLEAADIAAQLEASRCETTGFLDTNQWVPLAARGFCSWGGSPCAQFRRVSAHPEIRPAVVVVTNTLPSPTSSIRELRAALTRICGSASAIGDILVGASVVAACLPQCSEFLIKEAWRTLEAWPDWRPDLVRNSVGSRRLDAVVAAAFHLSRTEAQTAIEYGFVCRNFQSAARRTAEVCAGDQIVFRGKGRIEVASVSGTTRKGRFWLDYFFYPA